MMKLVLVMTVALAACGAPTKPIVASEPPATGSAAAGSAAIPNTDACAAVHGHCVTQAAGAACQSTSADECQLGEVCCNN